jgi:hypothetical protein
LAFIEIAKSCELLLILRSEGMSTYSPQMGLRDLAFMLSSLTEVLKTINLQQKVLYVYEKIKALPIINALKCKTRASKSNKKKFEGLSTFGAHFWLLYKKLH